MKICTPLLLFFIFCAQLAFAAKQIDLPTAVTQKAVSVKAEAMGGLGNDNLLLTIRNLGKDSVKIAVPPGLHFSSSDPGYQDLLTVEETMLAIKPGANATLALQGFCMQAANMAPGTNGYTFKGYAPANLKKLAEMLQKSEAVAYGYGQMFVWALTDKRSMYNIAVAKKDVAQAKEIVQFVSTVSGQPAVAVTAGTGPAIKPTVELFSNSAFVVFHNPNSQVANFSMFDNKGNEIHTFYTNRRLNAGVMKYEVGVNYMVPAGSNPVYTLKVTAANGKILAEKKVTKTSIPENIEPELLTFNVNCTLQQPVKNARLAVYLQDGTLVEEVANYKYMPIGTVKIKTKLLHLYPANTAFVAKIVGPDGKVHYTQTVQKDSE